ncbi:hypothetical protein D9Q81_07305 [Candidatus Korarchaeum cryptofilum]|jgi:hypothetical protein|uniref:Uncharacterized protein n=1 Tax=Candidatus Korarchaeum cryptofilum TaxID=498846 RepID=A0A429G200_9CREN|nr:hypothetical protein [Candidatus Korarchaeum cryptofilum]RSN67852.1 hypothetical protein D9Q81_07305 [Candidatus Korarchaeum cryptofilum]
MSAPFGTKNLLDWALDVVKYRGDTKIAAVNNILEVLESKPGDEDSIYLTIAFCLRQSARGVLSQGMADRIAKYLEEILKSPGQNKKEIAREFLGLVRWIFEVADKRRLDLRDVKSFDDLITKLGGTG